MWDYVKKLFLSFYHVDTEDENTLVTSTFKFIMLNYTKNNLLCVLKHMSVCHTCLIHAEARRRYQVLWNSSSRWLCTTTWVEPRSSVWTANALNCWVRLPATLLLFLCFLRATKYLLQLNACCMLHNGLYLTANVRDFPYYSCFLLH